MSNTSLTQPTDPKLNAQPVRLPNETGSEPVRRPNETGSISVQAHFRIFDPNTQKTIVEGRA